MGLYSQVPITSSSSSSVDKKILIKNEVDIGSESVITFTESKSHVLESSANNFNSNNLNSNLL